MLSCVFVLAQNSKVRVSRFYSPRKSLAGTSTFSVEQPASIPSSPETY
jgi:hypothetical protein